MRPTIGIALGSGGLRGLSHIGVLRVLEREQISFNYIAGCSIGGLIGALFATGLSCDSIYKLAKHLKRRHWLDFGIPKMGLVTGERALDMLQLLTQRKQFDQLQYQLAVVATDLHKGQEVVFTQGSVAEAVRASISVPGVFVPFALGDMLLVDGAVINPTPIDIAHKMGADVVIAVDLVPSGVVVPSINNMFDVIIQSLDIMERELLKNRLHYCDVLVKPNTDHISPSSFDNLDECVALGEQAMEEALPKLMSLLAAMEDTGAKCENPSHHGAIVQ